MSKSEEPRDPLKCPKCGGRLIYSKIWADEDEAIIICNGAKCNYRAAKKFLTSNHLEIIISYKRLEEQLNERREEDADLIQVFVERNQGLRNALQAIEDALDDWVANENNTIGPLAKCMRSIHKILKETPKE